MRVVGDSRNDLEATAVQAATFAGASFFPPPDSFHSRDKGKHLNHQHRQPAAARFGSNCSLALRKLKGSYIACQIECHFANHGRTSRCAQATDRPSEDHTFPPEALLSRELLPPSIRLCHSLIAIFLQWSD